MPDIWKILLKNEKYNNIILLYFGAMWCGPCKQLKKKIIINIYNGRTP